MHPRMHPGQSLHSGNVSGPEVGWLQAEPPAEATGPDRLGETAKANLRKAAANCKQLGWISFWTQLVLSTVSIVILLFSVAFSQSVMA